MVLKDHQYQNNVTTLGVSNGIKDFLKYMERSQPTLKTFHYVFETDPVI